MILKLFSFLLLLYGGDTILPAIREITLIKKCQKESYKFRLESNPECAKVLLSSIVEPLNSST